jgi:hypothetical protein
MRITKRFRRGLLVAIAIVAGSLAVAAPSQAAEPYTFQPTSLTVHDIEDWWPDNTDEVEIYYGGQRWSGQIGNGGTHYGPFPAASVQVADPSDPNDDYIEVNMYERDGSYLRYLCTRFARVGTTSVECGGPGQAFHYQLRYKQFGPLTVSVYCESSGGWKTCRASPGGGTEPYTIRWKVNGTYRSTLDNKTTFTAMCGSYGDPDTWTTVTAEVRDSKGATSSGTDEFLCLGNPPEDPSL